MYSTRRPDPGRLRGENDAPQVPLVGANAIVASVTQASPRGRLAADFLVWLQDKQISAVLAIETDGAGPSQKSHLADPGKWLGPAFSADHAAAYGEYIQTVNDNQLCLNILRIPECDRYLDVLDDAVRAVVDGQANAVESLAAVAREWNQVNEEIGIAGQRAAYRNSAGLSD